MKRANSLFRSAASSGLPVPISKWSDSDYYSESSGSIKLVPDKKSYRPGETAHVLAILPKEDANLLVTTERDNVMSARHVNVSGKTRDPRRADRIALCAECFSERHVCSQTATCTRAISGSSCPLATRC